ncbi:FCD domain-containing protein [Pasteurella multocida]|uniref:FCD domain-containing protein n=1 Tax=Pasteurella multocida TaxID=747 RepID=UPI002022999C|nr:FCD domain-containing protein [Pasteurella multocida]MCL7796600.1 FCD domain-containing protein [Pasteurella multocida]MCL7801173.1 FCD domain-containing protein [Pasteurella multocida]MDG2541759.1 FCD domain-containing protein [Pasteurella multocida]URH95770.1 FCD domain-containing protein [Pasteurella multocida]WND43503.1 FCD domain-containing protein [Pasteurella multocida]
MKSESNDQLRSYKKIGLLLKEDLKQGIYKLGERLPPERDIAEHFGVSRTVIREAIIMLELEELVEVKKGSGVYVINLPSDNKVLDLNMNPVDDIGPFELLQARQLLESGIAEFAAIQASRNDVLLLREILKREKETLSLGQDDYIEDKEFHYSIAQITQNEVLIRMQAQLWDYRVSSPMWKGLHARISNFEYRKRWLADHEAILNAIQRKDPALARKAMWQHLENVKEKLFELSDVDAPEFDGYLFNISPVVVGV